MKYLNPKAPQDWGVFSSPTNAFRDLALMHASVERTTDHLRGSLSEDVDAELLKLLNEAGSVVSIGKAQIEFALADTSDLPALNSCITAASAILRVARDCDEHQQLQELGEALRLIAVSCLNLISSFLPDDPPVQRAADPRRTIWDPASLAMVQPA
ncbi:MAG: hypothetical protein AAF585_27465 [Verrucomicrobiota bacterium]